MKYTDILFFNIVIKFNNNQDILNKLFQYILYNILIVLHDTTVSGQKQKIERGIIKELEILLRKEDFDKMVDIIDDINLNYKSINQLKQVFSQVTQSHSIKLAKKIWQSKKLNRIILTGILLDRGKIWERDKEFTINAIKKYAISENWQVREVAINLLKYSLIKSYDNYIDLLKSFIKSPNVHLRRVALSTAEAIATYKAKINFFDQEFLELFDSYLQERDSFIISVSTTTFGEFINNYPDITFKWFEKKINENISNYEKASLLFTFTNPIPKEKVNKALDFIEKTIAIDDDRVKHARSSVLRNLYRYYPTIISNWLESRLKDPNILEHWLELDLASDFIQEF